MKIGKKIKNKIISFKQALFDAGASTLLVFLFFVLAPFIFNTAIFKPYVRTMSDFEVTDIGFSATFDPDAIEGDTNIVLINTKDLSNMQMAWLINEVNKHDPKVVAINKILKKENNSSDTLLSLILDNTKNLVLAGSLKTDKKNGEYSLFERSDDSFMRNASTGFNNLLFYKDQKYSTVRSFVPTYKINLSIEYLFSVKVAMLYNPGSVKKLLSENIEKTINWTKFRKFFSITKFSDIEESPELLNLCSSKIVLMGTYDSENDPNLHHYYMKDKYFTPLNKNYAGKTYPDMYETDIHANIISLILNNNFSYSVPSYLNYIISVVFCFLTMLLYVYIKNLIDAWYELLTVIIFITFSIIILYISITAFNKYNIELRLNSAILALAISSAVFEAYYGSIKTLFKQFKNKIRGKQYEKI